MGASPGLAEINWSNSRTELELEFVEDFFGGSIIMGTWSSPIRWVDCTCEDWFQRDWICQVCFCWPERRP